MESATSGLAKLRTLLAEWAPRAELTSGPAAVTGFMAGLAGLFGLLMIATTQQDLRSFWALPLVAAGAVALGRTVFRWQKRWLARLEARLQAAGLLERIALEGLPAERITDYIPLWLRWQFPVLTGHRRELSSELRMIGKNLEWYLLPPRNVVKAIWLAPWGFALFFIVAEIAQLLVFRHSPFPVDQVWKITMPSLILTFGQLLFQAGIQIAAQCETLGLGVLARELKERLDGPRKLTDPGLRRQLGLPQEPLVAAERTTSGAGSTQDLSLTE